MGVHREVIIKRKKATFNGKDARIVIKTTPENPALWTGMKGVSAKGRKNISEMLKQVQHLI